MERYAHSGLQKSEVQVVMVLEILVLALEYCAYYSDGFAYLHIIMYYFEICGTNNF
jgi:uncharacterized membrane protein